MLTRTQGVLGFFVLMVFTVPAGGMQEVRTRATQIDSVSKAGAEAGKRAAESRFTLGYSLGSFLGGVPAGFWSLCLDQGDCQGLVLGGVAVIGGTSVVARLQSNRVPTSLSAGIEGEGPGYQDVFRFAYREELRRRHRRAVLFGGLAGIAVGLGLAGVAFGGG